MGLGLPLPAEVVVAHGRAGEDAAAERNAVQAQDDCAPLGAGSPPFGVAAAPVEGSALMAPPPCPMDTL